MNLAELCIEGYIQAVYYADDIQIKLNAGLILNQLITEIENSSDSAKKLASFMIKREELLAIYTAFQHIIRVNPYK